VRLVRLQKSVPIKTGVALARDRRSPLAENFRTIALNGDTDSISGADNSILDGEAKVRQHGRNLNDRRNPD